MPTQPLRSRGRTAFVPSAPLPLEARIVASARGASGALPGPHGRPALSVSAVQVQRDVVYRQVAGDVQVLDILAPSGPPPEGGWPVVVAIHGGGWRKFFKEDYEPRVAPLVSRGFLVVAPNYRLSKPGSPTWPLNLEELRDAVRWVRAHAGEIHADPRRIAAMGESAGGHLAALLGTDPEEGAASTSSRVQAVVDFYGPTDLARLDAISPEASPAIRQYLGTRPSRDPGRAADASPLTHVSADDPPFLIVQGMADSLVRPSQSRALATRLATAGGRVRLLLVRGADHGFGLRVGGRDLAPIIASFLADAMPVSG